MQSAAGFTVFVPAGWDVRHTPSGLAARSGGALVSVRRFRLERPYDPSQFAEARTELDRVAIELAAQAGSKLAERSTVTLDGRRGRAYRYGDTRLGFVLVGEREYELLCQAPGGGDPGGACALLFASFSVG